MAAWVHRANEASDQAKRRPAWPLFGPYRVSRFINVTQADKRYGRDTDHRPSRMQSSAKESDDMMTRDEALQFAHEWVAAWNRHDLNCILSHYSDDVEMSSPFIATLAGEATGMLKGKAAVAAYWQEALRRIPDLTFELIDVFVSSRSLCLLYNAVGGRRAVETMFFGENGKIWKAAAHYDRP